MKDKPIDFPGVPRVEWLRTNIPVTHMAISKGKLYLLNISKPRPKRRTSSSCLHPVAPDPDLVCYLDGNKRLEERDKAEMRAKNATYPICPKCGKRNPEALTRRRGRK